MKHRKLRTLMIALSALLCFSEAALAKMSYFHMDSKRSENLVPFPKWTGVKKRFIDEKKVRDGGCAPEKDSQCITREWLAMLDNVRGKPLRDQLERINDWANEHPYIIDQINWGLEDYWETPFEFLEVSGDCEDYAIAKYYSLRALGYSDDQLRIIVLQDLNLGGIIHAVLGVYDEGELLILDNQSQQVTPAMKIYHYRPIYGVNEDWWWAYYPKI